VPAVDTGRSGPSSQHLCGRKPDARAAARVPVVPVDPGPREAAPLQGYELVAHVFVAADRSVAAYRQLSALWQRCVQAFAVDDAVDRYPSELPATPPVVDEGAEFLAVRSGRAAGVHQVVVRRLHDVLCLSVVLAPAQAQGWGELDAAWRAVRPPTAPVVLGSVRILQARLVGSAATPDVTALAPVVAERSGLPPGSWRSGLLRAEPPLGPFAVWEADDGAEEPSWDGRADRCIAVVAPADRDPQLSAWTWSRGDRALTPFARYLLHAAKVRYEFRVRSTGRVKELRREAGETAGRLEPVAGRPRLTAPEATAAAADLARLRGLEIRLERARAWLRALRTTVQIAAVNMAAHARHDQAGGLFADDRGVADWLDSQLGRDLSFLEGSLELARRVVATVGPLVPEDVPVPGHATLQPAPEGGTMARLTGPQRKQLIAALAAAYPSYEALDLLFGTAFDDRRLADSSPPDALPLVLHRVLKDAEARGWTAELITAAALDNPGNPQLRALIDSGQLDEILAVRAALADPTGPVRDLLPQAGILADGVGAELEHVVRIAAAFQNVVPFATRLLELAARVCSVEVVTEKGRSAGTGFLVGPGLVLTNHHVLRAVIDGSASSTGVRCVFDYHICADGTVDHGFAVGLDESWLVASSPPSAVDEQAAPTGPPGDDELDYALVRLAAKPGEAILSDGRPRGWFELQTAPPAPAVGTPLLILQHPEQNPVKLAIDSRGVLDLNPNRTRVRYEVNTLHGSSGAPCLTFDLELAALHHSGSRDRVVKRNEGIPIATIAAHLQAGGHAADLGG